MPQFNPDKNLYSVAPVGQIVIIGRSMVLRGGMTREQALNLATWLIIAADATPDQVAASIAGSMVGSAPKGPGKAVMPLQPRTAPQPAPPRANPLEAQAVAPEVSGQVTPFIGTIDAEEAEAIDAAVVQVQSQGQKPGPKIPVIDAEEFGQKWGGLHHG